MTLPQSVKEDAATFSLKQILNFLTILICSQDNLKIDK
jgi:hypothetical protein